MRRILTIGTLVLSVMGAGTVLAQQPGSMPSDQQQMQQQQGEMGKTKAAVPTKDRTFIQKAAEENMAAIQLGKLAADRASSDQVRSFGNMMAQDHTQALDKLKKIASDKDVQVPSKLSSTDKREYDRLKKLSGDKFDREFIKTAKRDHQKTLSTFQKASTEVKTPELKDYASSTLPGIKKHSDELNQLKAGQKGATQQGTEQPMNQMQEQPKGEGR